MARRFEGQRLRPLERVAKDVYRAEAILGPRSADRKQRTFRGPKARCQRDAERWFGELVAPAAEDLRGKQEQPLSLYLGTWLESKRDAIKPSTYGRYKQIVEKSLTPALGDVRLCDLSSQHVRDYIADCKREKCRRGGSGEVSAKTIRNRVGVLSAAVSDALQEQPPLLDRDPIAPLRGKGRRRGALPRVSSAQTYVVGPAEAARVLRALEGTYLETLAYLALDTGARLGELLALRWQDVDLGRGVVTLSRTVVEAETSGEDWYAFDTPKSGVGRSVDLAEDTVRRLKAHRARTSEERLLYSKAWKRLDLVFPNTWQRRKVAPGTPLRPSTVSRRFRSLADEAGLEGLRFHDLRHACATIALQSGAPPHVVQKRLGHSDVQITLRIYSHVLPGQQKDAAEASWAAVAKELEAL